MNYNITTKYGMKAAYSAGDWFMEPHEEFTKGRYERCLDSFWFVLASAAAIGACTLTCSLSLFSNVHIPKMLGFVLSWAAHISAAAITVHAHHILQEVKAMRVTYYMATGKKL